MTKSILDLKYKLYSQMGYLTKLLHNNNYLNGFKCPSEIVILRYVNSVCINISVTRQFLYYCYV